MRRRITAIVLCLTTLISTFSFAFPAISLPAVAETVEKTVRITKDGEAIDELILPENEKAFLTAETEGIDDPTYQWQILYDAEKGIWISIYDKTEQECEMSYAVVRSVLDEAGGSCIRCRVSSGEETYTSDPVAVTILPPTFTPENSLPTASDQLAAQAASAAPRRASAASGAPGEDDGKEYVTVTIKYLDYAAGTGKEMPIYSPYVATIEKGTDITQDVISPTYIGFAPYYDADDPTNGKNIDDSAAQIHLNYTNVQSDIVIRVYYKAEQVRYAVRYFFQNITDDLYTENVSLYYVGKAETGTIITDEELETHAGDTAGFVRMYHVPDSVAADGSTVFECYYDRSYYLIRFDLDGGYGTDPIYARYGTPFIVNQPIKSGYTFAGWDLLKEDTDGDGEPDKGDGIADTVSTTIGTENLIYRALWERANTTYTRAYWATMADGSVRYLGSIRVDAKTGDVVKREDDLAKMYESVYPFDFHVHTIPGGCYENCPHKDHVHTTECYTSQKLSEPNDSQSPFKELLAQMAEAGQTALRRCVYRYLYGGKVYNYAFLAGKWYSLGTDDSTSGVGFDLTVKPSKEGRYVILKADLTKSCPAHDSDIGCYTNQTLTAATVKDTGYATISAIENPTDGTVARYCQWYTYYNYFYYDGTWYYLGNGTGATIKGVSIGTMDTPSSGNYTTKIATLICTNHHNHTTECLTCYKIEHIHTEACNPNPRYYVYDEEKNETEAGKEVTVEGDGSATLNIYYKAKEYTLRFIYARSSQNKDGEGNTYTKYEVAGGTTWPFGGYGHKSEAESASLKTLLGWVNQWGEVQNLPVYYNDHQLSGSTSDTDNYTLGKLDPEPGETGKAYTYYYFDCKACYDEDISTKWPIGILAPVKLGSPGSETKINNYSYAYFSAWNGEYKVKYSQDRLNNVDGDNNLTIKGRLMRLGERLLYDSKFEDSDVVNYLAFWENGASGVGWNIPKLFRYHLMLEVPKTTVITGTGTGNAITVTENGVSIPTDKIYVANENEFIGSTETYKGTDGKETTVSVPQEDKYDRIFRKYGDKYYEQFQSFRTFDNSDVFKQTAPVIDGFDYINRTSLTRPAGYKTIYNEILNEAYDVYFYYSRKEFSFTRFNYENVLGAQFVPYGKSLNEEQYNKDPDRYPPSLEPGAYEFVGWYTSPMRLYEIDWETATMPARDMIIYAKWVPVKHTVNFFTTYDEMVDFENNKTGTPYYTVDAIEHANVVGSVKTPTRKGDGNLELFFTGWFYIENGEKKAFVPTNMPIRSDMNIFADWSSSSPQPYRIEYRLYETGEEIAAPMTGYAYAGTTRTFTAKAGNPYGQLYDGYNTGYYPLVATHSITMQTENEEDNEHPKLNIYTFYYKKAKEVSYTVRYVNKLTGVAVAEEKTETTTDAVVTERFRTVPNMVPDAFYKRLVLTAPGNDGNSPENVITFYYTPNTSSAFYAVHFMLEKPGATEEQKKDYAIDGRGGYAESGTHVEGTGDLGKEIPITPQEFVGFKLIESPAYSTVGGDQTTPKEVNYADGHYNITVEADGTELYIFYKRLSYEYEVHYREYSTDREMSDVVPGAAPTKTGSAPYESTVTASASQIAGYTCVSKTEQSISIRPYDSVKDTDNPNVIIFYYAPVQYTALYVAVPEDGGILSRTREVVTGSVDFVGSQATEGKYTRFVGWYTDPECTKPVTEDNGSVTGTTFVPNKDKLSDTEPNIFYAKFERITKDLTIVRTDATDDGQVFVYEIRNNETGEVITLTVVGNGSATVKDLPCGEYTVVQKNGWSWRYDDVGQTVDHVIGGSETVVQYSQKEVNSSWLNGNSGREHNREGAT